MACMLRIPKKVLTNTQVRIIIYMFLLTLSRRCVDPHIRVMSYGWSVPATEGGEGQRTPQILRTFDARIRASNFFYSIVVTSMPARATPLQPLSSAFLDYIHGVLSNFLGPQPCTALMPQRKVNYTEKVSDELRRWLAALLSTARQVNMYPTVISTTH